jgi:hypothetical protein
MLSDNGREKVLKVTLNSFNLRRIMLLMHQKIFPSQELYHLLKCGVQVLNILIKLLTVMPMKIKKSKTKTIPEIQSLMMMALLTNSR